MDKILIVQVQPNLFRFVVHPVMALQTSPILLKLATHLTLVGPCVHMLGLNMSLNYLLLVRTCIANSTTKCFEA